MKSICILAAILIGLQLAAVLVLTHALNNMGYLW